MTALVQDVTIGRVALHEALTAQTQTTARGIELRLTGQESSPGIDDLTREQVRRRTEGLQAQIGAVVPVSFTAKPELDGWYRVVDCDVDVFEFAGGFWRAAWDARLELVARAPTIETSLRRAHRTNTHATTATVGEQWVAVPGAADAVDATELTSASTLTRPSEDGNVTVHRAWTANTPRLRWQIDPADWPTGRARILSDGHELVGEHQAVSPTGWEISNGIVRLAYSATAGRAGTLSVWHDGGWVTLTGWAPDRNGAVITDAPVSVEVLHVSAAEAGLRLLFGADRTTVDLTVRRGSRFVGVRVTSPAATSVGISTTGTGYTDVGGVAQWTASDGNGHRVCVGAEAWTTLNSDGIVRTGTAITGFIGALPGFSTLVAGDTALALLAQFIEQPVLVDQVVR